MFPPKRFAIFLPLINPWSWLWVDAQEVWMRSYVFKKKHRADAVVPLRTDDVEPCGTIGHGFTWSCR